MKPSTILLIVGLLAALVGIVWWDLSVFTTAGVSMPTFGWVALILGAVVTFALGAGLMFLLFYSNRRGYDDAAHGNASDEAHRDGLG